ncbi:unnamed protein product [Amoebophrya sp. A25]|nr:unnamed protein product [Amoebophrya sp. A25]|eukprot:GSA25T00011694001.1
MSRKRRRLLVAALGGCVSRAATQSWEEQPSRWDDKQQYNLGWTATRDSQPSSGQHDLEKDVASSREVVSAEKVTVVPKTGDIRVGVDHDGQRFFTRNLEKKRTTADSEKISECAVFSSRVSNAACEVATQILRHSGSYELVVRRVNRERDKDKGVDEDALVSVDGGDNTQGGKEDGRGALDKSCHVVQNRDVDHAELLSSGSDTTTTRSTAGAVATTTNTDAVSKPNILGRIYRALSMLFPPDFAEDTITSLDDGVEVSEHKGGSSPSAADHSLSGVGDSALNLGNMVDLDDVLQDPPPNVNVDEDLLGTTSGRSLQSAGGQSGEIITGTFQNTTFVLNGTVSGLVQEADLPLAVKGRWITDSKHRRVNLRCVNWYGPHMRQSVVNGLNVQPLHLIADTIVSSGFNCVRLTYSLDLVNNVTMKVPNAKHTLARNIDLIDLTPMQIFDRTVEVLTQRKIMVFLNNHVSSSGWCCSIDDGEGLWYTSRWSERDWIRSLVAVTLRYKNNNYVVGHDIRNEIRPSMGLSPTWFSADRYAAWAPAALRASLEIEKVHPKHLIVVSALYFGMFLCDVDKFPVHELLPGKVIYAVHAYKWYSVREKVRTMIEVYLGAFVAFIFLSWVFVLYLALMARYCPNNCFSRFVTACMRCLCRADPGSSIQKAGSGTSGRGVVMQAGRGRGGSAAVENFTPTSTSGGGAIVPYNTPGDEKVEERERCCALIRRNKLLSTAIIVTLCVPLLSGISGYFSSVCDLRYHIAAVTWFILASIFAGASVLIWFFVFVRWMIEYGPLVPDLASGTSKQLADLVKGSPLITDLLVGAPIVATDPLYVEQAAALERSKNPLYVEQAAALERNKRERRRERRQRRRDRRQRLQDSTAKGDYNSFNELVSSSEDSSGSSRSPRSSRGGHEQGNTRRGAEASTESLSGSREMPRKMSGGAVVANQSNSSTTGSRTLARGNSGSGAGGPLGGNEGMLRQRQVSAGSLQTAVSGISRASRGEILMGAYPQRERPHHVVVAGPGSKSVRGSAGVPLVRGTSVGAPSSSVGGNAVPPSTSAAQSRRQDLPLRDGGSVVDGRTRMDATTTTSAGRLEQGEVARSTSTSSETSDSASPLVGDEAENMQTALQRASLGLRQGFAELGLAVSSEEPTPLPHALRASSKARNKGSVGALLNPTLDEGNLQYGHPSASTSQLSSSSSSSSAGVRDAGTDDAAAILARQLVEQHDLVVGGPDQHGQRNTAAMRQVPDDIAAAGGVPRSSLATPAPGSCTPAASMGGGPLLRTSLSDLSRGGIVMNLEAAMSRAADEVESFHSVSEDERETADRHRGPNELLRFWIKSHP